MPLEAPEFKVDDFSDIAFWGKMFENLHTSLPANLDSSVKAFDIDSNTLELCKTRLIDEGYVQTPQLPWDDWFSNIKEAIELLERYIFALA